jgi:hypothetical protein
MSREEIHRSDGEKRNRSESEGTDPLKRQKITYSTTGNDKLHRKNRAHRMQEQKEARPRPETSQARKEARTPSRKSRRRFHGRSQDNACPRRSNGIVTPRHATRTTSATHKSATIQETRVSKHASQESRPRNTTTETYIIHDP